jgi:hypothetical protein
VHSCSWSGCIVAHCSSSGAVVAPVSVCVFVAPPAPLFRMPTAREQRVLSTFEP